MPMDDLTLDRSYARGDKGKKVKLIQEWLVLQGNHISIDGGFGPATETAVKQFQRKKGLAENGSVGGDTFDALVAPMVAAMAPIENGPRSLGPLVVAYAKRHLAQEPREVGGENRGPWVRLYMGGREGPEWLWCAGFSCYVLKQASETLGVPMPIPASFSCDVLAGSAKAKQRFVAGKAGFDPAQVGPGSLFLVRRTPTDWCHVGIVVKADAETFVTIEGNTNDNGSPDGFEVCQRIRGYSGKDFVVV